MSSETPPEIGDTVHYFERPPGSRIPLGPYAAMVTDVFWRNDHDDHRVHLTVFRVSRFTGDLVSGEERVPREGHDPDARHWWRPR